MPVGPEADPPFSRSRPCARCACSVRAARLLRPWALRRDGVAGARRQSRLCLPQEFIVMNAVAPSILASCHEGVNSSCRQGGQFAVSPDKSLICATRPPSLATVECDQARPSKATSSHSRSANSHTLRRFLRVQNSHWELFVMSGSIVMVSSHARSSTSSHGAPSFRPFVRAPAGRCSQGGHHVGNSRVNSHDRRQHTHFRRPLP